MECSRNNDDAEDVLGALQEAINLKWSAENRVVFQIADSPHHGKNYQLYEGNLLFYFTDILNYECKFDHQLIIENCQDLDSMIQSQQQIIIQKESKVNQSFQI